MMRVKTSAGAPRLLHSPDSTILGRCVNWKWKQNAMMGKYFLTRFRLKTVHRQFFFFMFKLIHSIVFCKSYTHSEGFFCLTGQCTQELIWPCCHWPEKLLNLNIYLYLLSYFLYSLHVFLFFWLQFPDCHVITVGCSTNYPLVITNTPWIIWRLENTQGHIYLCLITFSFNDIHKILKNWLQ